MGITIFDHLSVRLTVRDVKIISIVPGNQKNLISSRDSYNTGSLHQKLSDRILPLKRNNKILGLNLVHEKIYFTESFYFVFS